MPAASVQPRPYIIMIGRAAARVPRLNAHHALYALLAQDLAQQRRPRVDAYLRSLRSPDVSVECAGGRPRGCRCTPGDSSPLPTADPGDLAPVAAPVRGNGAGIRSVADVAALMPSKLGGGMAGSPAQVSSILGAVDW